MNQVETSSYKKKKKKVGIFKNKCFQTALKVFHSFAKIGSKYIKTTTSGKVIKSISNA